MQKIDGRMIQCMFPDSLLSEVDRIADRQGWTRAKTMRELLGLGCESYAFFEGLGFVAMADVVKRVRRSIETNAGQQSLF